jgi:hypothetical protein
MNMSHIPGVLWQDAGDVVRASLAAMDMGKPSTVVPEVLWNAIVFVLRHAPQRLLGRVRYRR